MMRGGHVPRCGIFFLKVDTCRHQRVDVTDRLIGSGFQQKANIGFVDRPAPYTDQTRAVASQHLENKSHVGSG